MTDSTTCIRCGNALPAGHDTTKPCPACLLDLGLVDSFGGGLVVTGEGERERPPTPEELDDELPGFDVLELIGAGGMGAVYRARQASLGREVALKVLPGARDAEFAERFEREARAMAALSHPGIVAVHDFGKSGDRAWLAMELVRGTSLRQAMRAGTLGPAEALAIVRQVCDALAYAHSRGVVHRDIKPENVLLDEHGAVKIADFGLAKLVGVSADGARLTGSGHRMGTPLYMAPEQVEDPTAVDHRADIYSLGVVLYELLTGELPLGRFAPPSRKVAIDVRLDDVVLRTLEKEPELRYQHASEVKTDLDHVSSSRSQKRASSMSDAPQKSSRLPWILLLVVLALIACVPLSCAAVWMFLGVRDVSQEGNPFGYEVIETPHPTAPAPVEAEIETAEPLEEPIEVEEELEDSTPR